MDPATTISGASDDLILIEGEVSEELVAEYDEPTYVRVGDWLFTVTYDGEWHVEVKTQPKGLGCQHYEVGELDEVRSYSEAVKFNTSPGKTAEKVSADWDPETHIPEDARLTNEEFETLMDLAMVSDPWPLDDGEEVMNDLLNSEAEARGHDSWYVAYHEI